MPQTRRSVLAALGSVLPLGLTARASDQPANLPTAPRLQFRSFEDSVRSAFAQPQELTCHRIEVGPSDLIQAGVQGCHNSRPFAGFPVGHLRIVRTGSEPGANWQGVRLYVTTVDVAMTGGLKPDLSSRPLDFSTLPAAPVFG